MFYAKECQSRRVSTIALEYIKELTPRLLGECYLCFVLMNGNGDMFLPQLSHKEEDNFEIDTSNRKVTSLYIKLEQL